MKTTREVPMKYHPRLVQRLPRRKLHLWTRGLIIFLGSLVGITAALVLLYFFFVIVFLL